VCSEVRQCTFGFHMSYVGGGRGVMVPTHSRPVRSLYSLQNACSFSKASRVSGVVVSSSYQYTRWLSFTTNSTFLDPCKESSHREDCVCVCVCVCVCARALTRAKDVQRGMTHRCRGGDRRVCVVLCPEKLVPCVRLEPSVLAIGVHTTCVVLFNHRCESGARRVVCEPRSLRPVSRRGVAWRGRHSCLRRKCVVPCV
jgi:hypothetical protein